MEKIKSKIRTIYKERGPFGLIFCPVDYVINTILKVLFRRKTIIRINAVDIYQRYKAISERIQENDKKIIEIGGAHTVLEHFLSHTYSLTIVDVDKEYIPKKEMKYYCQRTNKLPFKNNEFDCLVSSATLEHIPRQERKKSIHEWKRVAKKVLVYVPFGDAGKKYDQLLFSAQKIIGIQNKWLKEHIDYGIPTLEELKKYFPGASFSFIQNGNLWLITTFLTSIPIIGRVLPGLLYTLLSPLDKKEPCIGCVIMWMK